MFQSSSKRLRAWLEIVDDMLVGDEPVDARVEVPVWQTHPHRRPLRWQRERRAGSVPAVPAYCLCPVQPAHHRLAKRPTIRDSEHALTN